jgi:hypothetical protein
MTKVLGAQNAPPLGPDLPGSPVTNPKPLLPGLIRVQSIAGDGWPSQITGNGRGVC